MSSPSVVSWRRLAVPALAMAGIVAISNYLVQFPFNAWLTWAAFTYPIAYLVTDLTNRSAGPALARRVAWVGFAVGVVLSGLMAPWRIAFASGTAFIVSQLLDISVFNRLRGQTWWKAPFIGSAVASTVDTFLFFGLAFWGTGDTWDTLPGGESWVALTTGDLGVKFAMALLLLIPYGLVARRRAG